MTKSEKAHQDAIRSLGCIVCLIHVGVRSDCDIHHMLDGGRRIGEMHVLGLCPTHHRGGFNNPECVSRHPYKKAFEARYGSEEWLRDEANKRVRVAA